FRMLGTIKFLGKTENTLDLGSVFSDNRCGFRLCDTEMHVDIPFYLCSLDFCEGLKMLAALYCFILHYIDLQSTCLRLFVHPMFLFVSQQSIELMKEKVMCSFSLTKEDGIFVTCTTLIDVTAESSMLFFKENNDTLLHNCITSQSYLYTCGTTTNIQPLQDLRNKWILRKNITKLNLFTSRGIQLQKTYNNYRDMLEDLLYTLSPIQHVALELLEGKEKFLWRSILPLLILQGICTRDRYQGPRGSNLSSRLFADCKSGSGDEEYKEQDHILAGYAAEVDAEGKQEVYIRIYSLINFEIIALNTRKQDGMHVFFFFSFGMSWTNECTAQGSLRLSLAGSLKYLTKKNSSNASFIIVVYVNFLFFSFYKSTTRKSMLRFWDFLRKIYRVRMSSQTGEHLLL
ncbi:hypothetical protein ACJX0J_041413, partial [Zea mays]